MTKEKGIYRDGRKFLRPVIKEIVLKAEEGFSRRQLCEDYGVSYGRLEGWLREYGSSTYHASKKKVVDRSVKMEVVQAVLQGRTTLEEAARRLGIKSAQTIKHWITTFKGQNGYFIQTQPASMKKEKKTLTQSEEVKALKKALEQAELKVAALETLVTVAERELKIDIRKKSGARQSPK